MKRWAEAFVLAGVVPLVLLLGYPLAQYYWFASHETDTYALRTAEYLEGLRGGEWYPRWAGDMYGGFGSPFFIFYPPLVYALGALATPLVGSAAVALKGVALLATLVAGVSLYLLARHETGRPDAALLGAAIFLSAPYRVWDLYGRGDLAEYTALALLPLALFGYRSCAAQPSPTRAAWLAALAAVAHAGCVLSHTLLGLHGSAVLGLFVLGSAWGARRRGARRLAALPCCAFVFGLAMSAVYTLPALLEQRLVRTDLMGKGRYSPLNNLLTLEQLSELGQFFFLPPALLGLGLVLGVLALRRSAPAPLVGYGLVVLVALGLQLRAFSGVWTLAPFLELTQFPWRLLGLGWLALALVAALCWAELVRGRLLLRALGAAQLSALTPFLCLPLLAVVPVSREHVSQAPEAMRGALDGATALDEYLPRTVARVPAAPARSVAGDAAAVSVSWELNSNARHVVALYASAPVLLPFNLHAYPGWQLEHADGEGVTLTTTPDGYVALKIERTGAHRITVVFGSTPLRAAAGWLSFVALLALLPALHALSGAWGARRHA